jgi:RHS repeat-associated protein
MNDGNFYSIVNAAGSMIEEHSYDAWGNHRDPTDWKLSDFGSTLGINRGYTGHEMLSLFQLINMNGRMYDPVIGRVLAPDNYVADASNAQDYNRYTYCRNNPLRYTDPSGEIIYVDFGISKSEEGGYSVSIGFGVGFKNGVSAGVSTGYNFGNNSWNVGVNAGYAGGFVYAGYDTAGGFCTGTGYSYGIQYGIFSFSVFSMGVNYSKNGGFSSNFWWINYNQYSGFSVNPSFSMSTGVRWGNIDVENSTLDNFDVEQDKLTPFQYVDDAPIRQGIEAYIGSYDEYSINDISAFKVKKGYVRDDDGYLHREKDGKLVGGVTSMKYNGFGKPYSDIYLSQIRNREIFTNVINHELTHAYHHSIRHTDKRLSLMSGKDFLNYTESNAYPVGNQKVPAQYQYNGIWSYVYITPPKLIPLPPTLIRRMPSR